MRWVVVVMVMSCTFGEAQRPWIVDVPTVPEDVLARQDPGADTSHNKIIARDVASYHGSWKMDWHGGKYDAAAAIGFALASAALR